MKWILLLWLGLSTLVADAPRKLWTTPLATAIESSEGIVGADAAGTPIDERIREESLDDIPLAKTYPVDTLPTLHVAANQANSSDFDTKVDRIVEEIEHQSTATKKPTASTQRSARSVEAAHSPEPISDGKRPEAAYSKAQSDTALWLTLFGAYPLLSAALGLTLAALMLLVWRLGMKSRRRRHAESLPPETMVHPQHAISGTTRSPSLLIAFNRLRGEVHMAFLERKQNILFNDEFTQYQKAKALIELEKEYAAIAFFDLPELFSEDFGRFTEAQRRLSAKPELQGVIEKFVRSVLQQAAFTPAQKDTIRKNLQSHYNTHRHRWQYDERLERKPDEEQTAYLLQ